MFPTIDGYLEGIPHFQTDPGRVHGRKIDCKVVPAGEQKVVIPPTKWCLAFNKHNDFWLVVWNIGKNIGNSNPN